MAKGILCGLCGKPDVTTKHCLAGCSWVRSVENRRASEDRYTWRHNCILLCVAQAIIKKLVFINELPDIATEPTDVSKSYKTDFISSRKVGLKNSKRKVVPQTGILFTARDWKCNFDLREFLEGKHQMNFPSDICVTSKRIDGYIVSRSKRICILGPEITNPMDDNCEKRHSEKINKYRDMVSQERTWTFHDFAIEAGALGWVPPSCHKKLKDLGFTSKEVKQITDDMTIIARKCSYLIFVNRFNRDFKPWRIQLNPNPT